MQTFFGGPFRRGTPNRRDEKRRAVLRAEMGACFFQLNGLERDDVEYVMNTFPIVERRDTNRFGDTVRRLVLDHYDAVSGGNSHWRGVRQRTGITAGVSLSRPGPNLKWP